MGKLEGKVAVITGGASGIGLGTVEVFLEEGAKVGIIDYSDKLVDVIEKLKTKYDGKVVGAICDVSDAVKTREVVDEIASHFGGVDILVNNAGIGRYKPFLEMTLEDRDETIGINTLGNWNMCQAAIPYMLKKGKGSIVNVSSVTGPIVVDPGSSAYATSKGATMGLTKALAIEFAKNNIRVNAIQPGIINTPMVTDSLGGASEGSDSANQMAADIPMQRFGTPREPANLIAFLASDEASYITGQGIVIDGGSTLPETNNLLAGIN